MPRRRKRIDVARTAVRPLPISAAIANHYVWGSGCDGWHLVAGDELSVIEERMPPGTNEVRHRHDRARQFFYVLLGSLRIEIDGAMHDLLPGAGIEVPPGCVHQVMNGTDAEARFLVVSQPRAQGDRTIVPAFTGRAPDR